MTGSDSLSPSILETPLSHCPVDPSVISAMATKSKWRSTYDSDRRHNKTWEGMYPWVTKHQMDQKNNFVGCVMQSCSQGSQLLLPMRKPRNTNRKSELLPQHCLFLWCEHIEWQRMSAILSCNWPFSQPATCHSRRWIILEKSSHTMEKEALLGELSFTAPNAAN